MDQMLRPASAVAKTILNAITTDSPHLRYPVGEDAISILNARKKLPDNEFVKLIEKSTPVRLIMILALYRDLLYGGVYIFTIEH